LVAGDVSGMNELLVQSLGSRRLLWVA
jgi:hypothetical protein